ncbi:MAG TPA: M13 family metallopeptidase, partial [Acidobacteriota bacterium]
MKNRVCLFTLLFFFAAGFAALTAEQGDHGIDVKAMNTTVNPCEDFYQFAGGNWMSNNPIPADRSSWGTGAELQERNLQTLHEILEETAKNTSAPKGSIVAKVGTFYRTGMDEAQIEKDGIRPLQEEFARIDTIKDAKALRDAIADFHKHGISPAFGFFAYQDFKNSNQTVGWLYQGGLGLPDRDYYFREDEKTKEIRKEYVLHVQKMFELLGDKPDSAAAQAKTVMDMETRLAKVSMTVVEQRNPEAIYHMMQLSDLQRIAPQFLWATYFQAIGLSTPGEMNIAQPEFFKEFSKMQTEVSLKDWKTYLRWQLIHATAPYLSSAFVKEDFRFNSQVLRGIQEIRPRWKRVLESTDTRLGEALGQLYVAKAFPPEAKARAKELVANLRAALRERIATRDWIGEETRKQALRKLDAVMVKIGYPDQWRDYSALPVDRGSYVLNVMQADAFEFERNLNKIGKPVDRAEWGMSPPTVNAYYNPNFNEIVFPAGILQPPFFDAKADDAVN